MGSNKVRSKAPSSGKGDGDLPSARTNGDKGPRIKAGIVGGDGDLRGFTKKTGECDPGGPQGKIKRMTDSGDTTL